MTTITKYSNSYNTVSKMICDGSAYVWIAYNVDSSGICHLQKVFARNFDQVYFDISVTAHKIIDMVIYNSYIHLLFDNLTEDYIGAAYHTLSPSINNFTYARQNDVIEEPVAVSYSSFDTCINILTPGSTSATNAMIYRYSATDGSYDETVAVRVGDIHIVDAVDIIRDSTDHQWIITDTDPTKIIRMWFASGGWYFSFHNIK